MSEGVIQRFLGGLRGLLREEPAPEQYRAEMLEMGPAMTRIGAILAIVVFSGMAVVDPLVVQGEALRDVYWTRAITCSSLVLIVAASLTGRWVRAWSRALSLLVALISGSTIATLAYLTGGSASDYHQAFLVGFFGFAMLPLPWGRFDALTVYGTNVLTYNVLLVASGRFEPGPLWTHNAVILAGLIIATVLQRLLAQQRLASFNAREALASANERLKSLDAAKSHFFSNISHELRTPLTLIVAPLEAILESPREPLSAGQRERLRLAQRNALRLLRLVDDLLSLARAEAASLKLHARPLDLGELVQSFAEDVSELAARKNILVEVAVGGEPLTVEGDPTLIERVLLNVFANAARFVPVGGHIAIEVVGYEGGVEIATSDNGCGIAPEHLPHIFDRFYQADSATTRSTGGTGIGLSLVMEIAELHGGWVRAESVPGAGTTIRCWFPARLPASVEASVVRSAQPGVEPQGLPEWHQAIRTARSYRYQGIDDATERRVAPRPSARGDAPTLLVVEDNPDMIRFLVALLAYDYNVLTAQNGKDGLRMALERAPDLIISDVMMPEMDGFEMVRRLREDEHGARIPLIFLTARGSSDDRIQGHSGGADTYLAKPFRSEELLAAVDALLTRQKSVLDSASSREDEALVYMASGISERLTQVLAALGEGRAASPREGLEPLRELVTALRRLAEAGVHPPTRPVGLDDAVRGLLAELDDQARAGKAVHLELSAREVVALDEGEVRAIVEPLLRRALRVTPIGRNVYVATARRRGGPGEPVAATLSIRDEGPTLSPDQLERLFFPFASAEDEPGAGLDLARARSTLLARGGGVTIEPGGELGNRVVITLPLAGRPGPEEGA